MLVMVVRNFVLVSTDSEGSPANSFLSMTHKGGLPSDSAKLTLSAEEITTKSRNARVSIRQRAVVSWWIHLCRCCRCLSSLANWKGERRPLERWLHRLAQLLGSPPCNPARRFLRCMSQFAGFH